MENNTELNKDVSKVVRLTGGKLAACYAVALFFSSFLIYILSGFIADISSYFVSVLGGGDDKVQFYHIFFGFGAIYTLLSLGNKVGNQWRSSGESIGTGVFSIPNFFYDPTFQKSSNHLRLQYYKLVRELKNLQDKHDETVEGYEKAVGFLENLRKNMAVLIRHHENASRLVDALNYSIQTGRYKISDVIKDTLSESITVLEKDLSDKSISLFQVEEDLLLIRDGIRIHAESKITRSFKKGEGFAGTVWDEGKPTFINNIDFNTDTRFNQFEQPQRPRFKSIMGIPLKVNGDIIGVLCIQSEEEDGFSTNDFRPLEFYANLCTLLILFDTMKVKGKGGEEICQ